MNLAVWQDNPRLVQGLITDRTHGAARVAHLTTAPRNGYRYDDIADYARAPVVNGAQPTRFIIRDIPCTDLARELYQRDNSNIPYIVSFANKGVHENRRGGGVKEGTSAQEEDIWRETTTGFTLDDSLKGTGYANSAELQDLAQQDLYDGGGIPDTGGLYCPAYIIRKGRADGYEPLTTPVPIAVGTVAAIKHRPAVTALNAAQIDSMKKRIYTQLKMAADNGHRRVIMGAFGCGAFGNPPDLIARLTKEVIDQKFPGKFDEIHFAILSDHSGRDNFTPFADHFSATAPRQTQILDRLGQPVLGYDMTLAMGRSMVEELD